MNKHTLLFLILFFPFFAYSSEQINTPTQKTYYVLKSHNLFNNVGAFSLFRLVLSTLSYYENHTNEIAGLKIDFGKEGLYYDHKYGPNWWEYYFEPICLGSRTNAIIGNWNDLPAVSLLSSDFHLDRLANHKIISKYIRVKPHILQKVDNITSRHFDKFMIGVHYRGTDKSTEAPRVKYDKVVQAIMSLVSELDLTEYKVFVATDEQSFLDFMRNSFPDKVVCYEKAYRSCNGKPLHFDKNLSPYKKGEDAIVDCLLLSKCHYLFATCSHLSLCSTFFNISLPVFVLNDYYLPHEVGKICEK